MKRELPKGYEPSEVEDRLYAWWESSGFFHAEPGDDGEPFAVVLPPPNVTGNLHIGHALVVSVEDAMVRHARMTGHNAVWLPGTDHAGIATQTVVERRLAEEGLTRHDLGREAFIERVWEHVGEYGGTILRQERKLGASLDWDREIFTLDETRSEAVKAAFRRWYADDLIYRGLRLINWCPRCLTALSDIEVDHQEVDGELAYLRYPLMGSDDPESGVTVATTRAETMLGDTAVAVHPDDERYAHLIGRSLRLPLMDREIPVIADAHVDAEFGTGAVKVTPAHDPNDYEIGQRHDLAMIDIITNEAAISEAGGAYAGLDRVEARRKVTADLDAQGLLAGVESHRHSVGVCSRCKTVIEPRLSEQWFVAVRRLADAAAAAVREGRTGFVPERNAKGFLDWLDNLHDWCISRQLWWGHQIPAWYDRDGNLHVPSDDPSPEETERLGLTQDPDVLDTWFSSQLWPLTTLGWTGEDGADVTPELRTWYPTAVLETGYDINTFWVSRMLMAGLYFAGEVPFRTVYNHGMVRDGQGKKMSKSFGNTIDPLDFIEKYGADALRFALLRAATPGQDAPLAEEWVEGARRFANKLWNAARFVLMVADETVATQGLPPEGLLELEDRWILSRLDATRATVDDAMTTWDLGRVARAVYHFVWDEYCDWYLELAKQRDDEAVGAVLVHVLDVALRLLHPLMPFVTEEIWRALHQASDDETLMRASWPAPDVARRDQAAESQFAALQEAVTELRRFRAEHRLSPAERLTVTADADAASRAVLEPALPGIRQLAGVGEWSFSTSATDEGPQGKVSMKGAELFIPLTGLVDLDEERARIERELATAHAERERAERKLANTGFVQKAPEALVQSEREKLVEWQTAIARLSGQREELAS